MRLRLRHIVTFIAIVFVAVLVLFLASIVIVPGNIATMDILVLFVGLVCAGWLMWSAWRNRGRERRTLYRTFERWLDDHRDGQNLSVPAQKNRLTVELVVSNRWWRRGVCCVNPNDLGPSGSGESYSVSAQFFELVPVFWEIGLSSETLPTYDCGNAEVSIVRARAPLSRTVRTLLSGFKVAAPPVDTLRTLVGDMERAVPKNLPALPSQTLAPPPSAQ